jgi:hypothetical protein
LDGRVSSMDPAEGASPKPKAMIRPAPARSWFCTLGTSGRTTAGPPWGVMWHRSGSERKGTRSLSKLEQLEEETQHLY